MSLIYDGSHSMAFIKVNGDGTTVVKRTWEDWHLIPVTNLIVNPPSPSVSFVRMPYSNNFFDASTIPSGNITMGGRSGEWEFYVDHDQWDNWAQTFDEIELFVNGKRLYCVLDDDYTNAYVGRMTFNGWKNGDSYSIITIGYYLAPYATENEFDYLTYNGTFYSFDLHGIIFYDTWPMEWLRRYLRVWREYENGIQVEETDYTLSGNTTIPGDREITIIAKNETLTFVVHIVEDGWEVDDTNILDVYPVGSIYMSVSPTNPQIIFGGIWESWGQGRVPVGVDTEDSDFEEAENTGGEKEHSLTTNELPVHRHTLDYTVSGSNGSSTSTPSNYVGRIMRDRTNTQSTSQYTATIDTRSVGSSNNAHNIMQPYITCYMWKRVS